MTDLTAEADRRLQEAIDASDSRDPREFYRERLRELKGSNAEGYQNAVAYYRDTLIPQVASGEVEPLVAWAEYGRTLAEAAAVGRTVSIDETGRAHPYEAPMDGRLVLHLPDDPKVRAILVGLPTDLSSAQRVTYDALVLGKQRRK